MATKKQIPTLAGEMVKNQEGLNVLSEQDAQDAILDTPSFLALACEAWKNRNVSLSPVLLQVAQTDEEQLNDWHRFNSEVLGLADMEPFNPTLPKPASGFGWMIVIRKGLTLNKVLEIMRAKMTVWISFDEDLDKGVPANDRTADNDYAIRIRDRIEADEELKSLSANEIGRKKITGITLLERLVLELFYFWKAGPQADIDKAHLDVKNVTLCTGSRDSDGDVPSVDWDPGDRRVRICWYRPDGSDDDGRARAVQLLEPSHL
jgi:hypothetical protein